ncbi:FAD-dependent monooxygenase [Ramlibacter sp. AN1133]|uniref:FAD-dependent monooxygenase n=1 Tax=Ramlibacter sp. AN1133 TaxID=3133429 RepID=UPI0030BF3C29
MMERSSTLSSIRTATSAFPGPFGTAGHVFHCDESNAGAGSYSTLTPVAFAGVPVRAQVLVVGAGPVGLTLATGLAQRGITDAQTFTFHIGAPGSNRHCARCA